MQRLCLEGTTERSDSNRGRSPRKKQLQQFCLEGSTPVAVNKLHVLWRSAFQAHRSRIDYPRTSSPVTIATLSSAFQAQKFIYMHLFLTFSAALGIARPSS